MNRSLRTPAMFPRTFALALAGLIASALPACGPGGDAGQMGPQPAIDQKSTGDLTVTLGVAERLLTVGQTVKVRISATNTGTEPIPVDAPSSAKAFAHIWRRTPRGWTRVARYPQTDLQVLSPWKLAPGQTRHFDLTVPVEPSWPTRETLRLAGEINGRGQTQPIVLVEVFDRPEPTDKEYVE